MFALLPSPHSRLRLENRGVIALLEGSYSRVAAQQVAQTNTAVCVAESLRSGGPSRVRGVPCRDPQREAHSLSARGGGARH
jgi:hypothetical protein